MAYIAHPRRCFDRRRQYSKRELGLVSERPLLDVLLKWIGRRPTQQAFEARGFLVHKTWQQRIIQICGEEKSDLLNRYWDEVAMETVGSAGQGDPKSRWFPVLPIYRSAFLDDLAGKVDFADSKFRNPPPIRCLFDYSRKLYDDQHLRFEEAIFFENLKRLESERLAIRTSGWTGKKRDVMPFIARFGGELGFGPYRNRCRKTIGNGLVFDVRVDLGGQPECLGHIPLLFSIFHRDDPKFVHDIALFERILPGFDRYFYGESPDVFVLGIRAHMELFSILADSFENS